MKTIVIIKWLKPLFDALHNEFKISSIKPTLKLFSLIIFICGNSISSTGQNLSVKVVGNEKEGFGVDIYDGNKVLVSNKGEFSLLMSNLDLSVESEMISWKGANYKTDGNNVTLEQETFLEHFDANLYVRVNYEVVNPNLIKKTVTLFQPSIPSLYFTLIQDNIPASSPKRYVTFEYEDFPGGIVHELFPAAGFVTGENMVVGFLTDAGYKNHFTRTTRRRFSDGGGGMVGMRKLPDVELFSVATQDERLQQKNYVRQTFGRLYNLDFGNSYILPLPDLSEEGDIIVQKNDSLINMSIKSDANAGVTFKMPMSGQKIYTISFSTKGDVPVAVKLHRINNGVIKDELEHGIKYIDQFPSFENEWTEFKGSVLLPYIENDSVVMFIGSHSGKGSLQIKNLHLEENYPLIESYNILPIGQSVEKTTYVFAEPWKSQKDFMISAQTRLSEGKNFKGSTIEKMLYANLQMLTWVTSVADFTPFNVPNLNYSPDMYNRDSFWSIISTYNKELNVSIWNQWAKTQNSKGAIGTIITPYMGSVEVKDNEATIEWLIWALLNKRRFGIEPPKEKIELAAQYVLDEFDENRDGICESHFSMSQVDVMEYFPKTDRMAVNQGMFSIGLRTIKELGFDIDDEYLAKAEKEYRNFYDPQRKHLLFDRDYPDIITLTDLIPEFLSLWLYDRPLLTDEMVINHLEQIPVLNKVENSPHPEFGTTAPICVRLTNDEQGYTYMTPDYQPFGEFGIDNYGNNARDGLYYNGGSWLRAEYCAWVTGLKHGWVKANKLMENRLWAEINLNPKMPYSKEFIPTTFLPIDEWWKSTRGLCWNVFVLMANELAGIRSPEMDPDYQDK